MQQCTLCKGAETMELTSIEFKILKLFMGARAEYLQKSRFMRRHGRINILLMITILWFISVKSGIKSEKGTENLISEQSGVWDIR